MSLHRRRAWLEVALATLASVLALLTAVYPTWFEAIFEASPDQGSGAFEWAIVAVLASAAIVSGAAARRDFRRSRVGGSPA